MDEQELLEPINLFQNSLKEKHKEIVERYFDNLTAKSGVDVNANALTCKEYYVVLARIDSSKKKLSGQRGLRIFLVISAILFFLVGTILLTLGIKDALGTFKVWGIIIAILLILSGIAFIVINIVVLNKRIRGIEQNIKDLQQKAKILKSEAEKQMAPLNALFDWNIPSTLATEAAPILQLDKNFPAERFYHLVERFEMKEDKGKNASTIFVQSGTIVDNPFIIERDYVQTMYDHVYTGTLVVSWTTTVSDGKGGRRVVHHTQTLVATITKPAPSYHLDTNTIYANDAAPHLSFTRKIGPGNSVSASELTRFDAAWDKKLAKMQRKEIKSTFTPIGNSKFEGLFQAFDRDNEVEFRVLFTPLGQKNMINLLISKKPYGDDFEFIKKKYINIIHSTHMQTLDYDGNPYHFLGFDHEVHITVRHLYMIGPILLFNSI